MREQIASIHVFLEDAVIRLSGEAGRITESSPDTRVFSMIQTVIHRNVAKDFRSATFYSDV